MDKLKTAILGLCETGIELLEAASQSRFFEITAVADIDPEVAEKTADRYGCSWFDDYRRFVIQNQLDLLVVAAPMHQCDEYVRAAMKKKFHILKLLPPAVNFEELAELVRLSRKESVRFAVAKSSRFSPAYCAMREFILSEGAENFHLVTAICNIPDQLDEAQERWHFDPELAGGGVLLYNCYEIIDQIILNFGIPQQVYSLSTNYAPDKQQRLSLTEDTSVVTMKFSDTLAGTLVASRIFGPYEQMLRVHGKEQYLTVRDGVFTVCDNQGNVLKKLKSKSGGDESMTKMLESIALNILDPEKNKASGDENADLNNMAVIESAYLSARTAMPEEPGRILDMI